GRDPPPHRCGIPGSDAAGPGRDGPERRPGVDRPRGESPGHHIPAGGRGGRPVPRPLRQVQPAVRGAASGLSIARVAGGIGNPLVQDSWNLTAALLETVREIAATPSMQTPERTFR